MRHSSHNEDVPWRNSPLVVAANAILPPRKDTNSREPRARGNKCDAARKNSESKRRGRSGNSWLHLDCFPPRVLFSVNPSCAQIISTATFDSARAATGRRKKTHRRKQQSVPRREDTRRLRCPSLEKKGEWSSLVLSETKSTLQEVTPRLLCPQSPRTSNRTAPFHTTNASSLHALPVDTQEISSHLYEGSCIHKRCENVQNTSENIRSASGGQ